MYIFHNQSFYFITINLNRFFHLTMYMFLYHLSYHIYNFLQNDYHLSMFLYHNHVIYHLSNNLHISIHLYVNIYHNHLLYHFPNHHHLYKFVYNTYITIYMIKYTSSISFIIFPISFIFSTIRPDLYTITITIYTNPNIYIILYHSPVYVAPFSYVCVVLLSLTVSVSPVVGNIISTLFGLFESFDC